MIKIKSSREIELMKQAAEVVKKVFKALKPMCKSGVSTQELDVLAEKVMLENDSKSSSKGYYGFPGAICISVNETLVHGIPSKKIILKEGDIVSLDVVVNYKGYHADACRTYPVGIIKDNAKRLIEVTKESFFEGISKVHDGAHLGDVSEAIQKYNESHGYSVSRDYTGHGIGSSMHEDPSIPNHGVAGTGPILKAGMTLAIEPMVCEGKPATRVLGDGWTAKTKDGKLSCHYENTILVTESGCEILTMDESEE